MAGLSPTGWSTPKDPNPPAFTLMVVGDLRLPEAAYPFFRRKLDRLLARRLPSVRVAYVWKSTGADFMAAKYARERRLSLNLVKSRKPEVIGEVKPTAVVVFDGGAGESRELVARARADGIPVRVVDVRAFVNPAQG